MVFLESNLEAHQIPENVIQNYLEINSEVVMWNERSFGGKNKTNGEVIGPMQDKCKNICVVMCWWNAWSQG